MEIPDSTPLPDLTRFRRIRVIDCRERNPDRNFETEINECLAHGWSILVIQPGEAYAKVFLGWPSTEEPPLTQQQQRSAESLKKVVWEPPQE